MQRTVATLIKEKFYRNIYLVIYVYPCNFFHTIPQQSYVSTSNNSHMLANQKLSFYFNIHVDAYILRFKKKSLLKYK